MDVGYVAAFLGGALTLVSPCSALLLPAFFAYAFGSPTRVAARSGVFYAGLATTLVPLGVAASTAGALINEHRSALVVVASSIVIGLGVLQLSGRGFGVGAPARLTSGDPGSALSVYLLGAVYGVAGVCSGPILGAMLAMSAIGADPVYGGLLLAVYALGMAAPVFVLALIWGRLDPDKRRWLRGRDIVVGRWRVHSSQLVSGLLFVAIGVLLLVTDGTAGIGGLFSVDTEYQAQLWARDLGQRVPDLIAVAAGVVVAALLVWRYHRRRSRRDSSSPHRVPTDGGS